jgi:hypothetical protein
MTHISKDGSEDIVGVDKVNKSELCSRWTIAFTKPAGNDLVS